MIRVTRNLRIGNAGRARNPCLWKSEFGYPGQTTRYTLGELLGNGKPAATADAILAILGYDSFGKGLAFASPLRSVALGWSCLWWNGGGIVY